MRALWLLPILLLAGCSETASNDTPVDDPAPIPPALSFLAPVRLECPATVADPIQTATMGTCDRFGEPQVEVQGDGTIWYSTVCCIGRSPPIWRSFDGGLTFEAMPFADGTGATRDAFGIEGDFAVDDAGNVYFFDIAAATTYFTKYNADGSHAFTKADPMRPLVDRPWVRAGAANEVFIAFNNIGSTTFVRSDDGGLTWDHAGATVFPCGIGTLGQGPVRDHLILAGCTSSPSVWQSHDGGRTWGERVALPLPEGAPPSEWEPIMPPSADDAGTAYVPIVSLEPDGDDSSRIFVTGIRADGTFVEPVAIAGPAPGMAQKPWLVAGREGTVAVAWFGSDATFEEQSTAEWRLWVAHTQNADAARPTWQVVQADPAPVLDGPFGRRVGDFLQVRHAENGDLVVAYASHEGGMHSRFVRSTGLDLGRATFPNGPMP